MKIDKERTLFAIASFIFINRRIQFYLRPRIRNIGELGCGDCIVDVAYAIFYFVNEKSKGARKSKQLLTLFVTFVALSLVTLAFDIIYIGTQETLPAAAIPEVNLVRGLLQPVPLIIPLALLVFLARNLHIQKVAKKYEKRMAALSYLLYFTAIAFLIICYLSGWVFRPNAVHLDDEEFIGLNAANIFVRGQNPYTANFTGILESNLSKTVSGPTYMKGGRIVGFLSYPALSFLIYAPFTFINNTGIYHFTYDGFYIILPLFAFVLVLAMSHVLKKEYIKKPPACAIIALLFAFAAFASINNYLTLALLLIALYRVESRYLWVVLGVLASLQEEVWVIVLLFLIYVLRNYGVKKCSYNLLGTVFVFILINGYFMMLSPLAFVRGILSVANGMVGASPFPAFGYLLLKLYSALNEIIIFFVALIATLVTSYYLNLKKLIPLFGQLPLMFLFNGTPIYYVFFISALVISMYSGRMPDIRQKAGHFHRPRMKS